MQAKGDIPTLNSLELFDSCVTLGRVFMPGASVDMTVKKAIEIIDRYGILEALVHHQEARNEYPRDIGNHLLLDSIKGQKRLHPVWVMEPPRVPGRSVADEMVSQMLSAGVKAVRLPMKRVPPFPWIWNDLCTALEMHAIPAFMDFGNDSTCGVPSDTDMNGVREIALTHPGLPLVFSHAFGGLGFNSGIPYLMYQVDNIYLDITSILDYWRNIAHEVGPHRILFATGTPFTDPGICISNIQYMSDFSLEEKKMMCGGNLRKLLENVQ